MDGRRYLHSLSSQILEPLRVHHSVDIFIATYPSPILTDIVEALQPIAVALPDPKKSAQVPTYLEGLKLFEGSGVNYDRIICTRFDLRYLKSIEQWNIWNKQGIFFPWREYEEGWSKEHFVGDAIHVIDGPYFANFKSGLARQPSKFDLHHLYDALTPLTSDLFFIESGFYDSNTMYGNKECRNPLYRIGNRVRIPFSQPNGFDNRPLSWSKKMYWRFTSWILAPFAWWSRLTFKATHRGLNPSVSKPS